METAVPEATIRGLKYVLSKSMRDSRMRLIVKSDKTLKNLLLKNKNEIKNLDIGTYDLIKTIERKKR
ncbi:MAG: hypothetical protein K2Q18_10530 [Bdellovibrionales bacterium]|nr:hypothetical protein [Bdellovibrionales bacterium]